MSSNAAFTASAVSKVFGATAVLKSVDLTIEKGEFVVLLGPSGCGKSTLMRCIAGLEKIDGGTLTIEGRDVTKAAPADRDVAMVFQSYALFPHMSVAENIGFGMRIARRPKAEIERRVLDAAKLLKIDHLLDRKPRALSGGQRQRVAIGRAIVRNPKIFLFDEPLSNLDAALRLETRVELTRLHRRIGNTMIYVTHDQVEAMTMADRIVVMRDGNIEQIGTPLELYNNPRNLFVATFLGQPSMNILSGRVSDSGGPGLVIDFGSNGAVRSQRGANHPNDTLVRVGIRPEDLIVDPAGSLNAAVELVEQLGNEILIHCRLADEQLLTVKAPGQGRFTQGETISFSVAPDKTVTFDEAGRVQA